MHSQRLTALAVALVLATPLSLFAETSNRKRTDMDALAADLERVLGHGHVKIGGFPPVDPAATPVGTFEEAVVEAMNHQRATYGLSLLRINPRLSLAASDRMNDLFAKHYFNHVSPDGLEPWTWVQKRGYAFRQIGENLAVGYASAEAVVDGWMHSPEHRANVLGSGYDDVGVAIAAGSPTRGYRGPTVVALYGDR